MTDLRKAAEMALEALEGALSDDQPYIEKSKKAAEALRQALAQPVDAVNMTQERVDETAKREHEPVAYTGNGTAGREADVRPTGFFFQMPKREWVGLTDTEIDEIMRPLTQNQPFSWRAFGHAIARRLKEKNT